MRRLRVFLVVLSVAVLGGCAKPVVSEDVGGPSVVPGPSRSVATFTLCGTVLYSGYAAPVPTRLAVPTDSDRLHASGTGWPSLPPMKPGAGGVDVLIELTKRCDHGYQVAVSAATGYSTRSVARASDGTIAGLSLVKPDPAATGVLYAYLGGRLSGVARF